MPVTLSQNIVNIAKQELGFTSVAIIPAEPTTTFSQYSSWVDDGFYGSMEWMQAGERKQKRSDVRNIMPTAKSIITLSYSYYTADIPDIILNDPSRGIFARYAWGRDYHKVLEKKLQIFISRLKELIGPSIKAKAYVDTGPVLERALAARAGLGFIGKNSMLINSALGSYLFIAEIIIDQECEPLPARDNRGACRLCTKCIDKCPTQAIVKPFVIDARQCISYLTIENKGSIPEKLRPLLKNRIYGCDICQEVCPWNSTAKAKSHKSDWLEAELEQQAPKLTALAKLTDETFLARFQGTPITRVKRGGLLRNVAVALGNWGTNEAGEALTWLAQDKDSLVREHASWGLKQV